MCFFACFSLSFAIILHSEIRNSPDDHIKNKSMKNDFENATVVANESANVAVEAASINNFNSDVMEEEKIIATEVAPMNVADATVESFNVAEDAASTNNLNFTDMVEKEEKITLKTKIAIINGEEKSIIVAHTEYGMEKPKDSKNLMGIIDRSKLLPCTYCFTSPELFWDANMRLKDEEGNVIEEGTPNVYVFCPTGDTYWRLSIDEKLERVEMRNYESVEEYAQSIGTTNLYSRGLTNTEKVGIAALATGDEACKVVFMFAKKHEMNITNAKLYLDCTMKPTTIMEMTMGTMPEKTLTLGRTMKEAEKLLEETTKKLAKNAEKRYAIRAINQLLRNGEYSMKQMLKAIKRVSDSDKLKFETATSEGKESEMTHILTKILEKIKQDEVKKLEEQKEAA